MIMSAVSLTTSGINVRLVSGTGITHFMAVGDQSRPLERLDLSPH